MLSKPNILVATDFSEHSDKAILMAMEIAKRTEGSVKILHVSGIPPLWDWIPGDLFQKGLFSELSARMDDQLKRCQVECENDILFGDPYEELQRYIRESKPDMLLMGHDRGKGFFYIGSLAQKMITSSTIPVLVVNSFAPPMKVAGLIDPSFISGKVVSMTEELSYLLNLEARYLSVVIDIPALAVSPIGEEMSFVFTDDQKSEISKTVKDTVSGMMEKNTKAKIDVLISKDKISDAIIKNLDDEQTDIVVICRHNRGAVERFFLGSVSRRIVERFKGNILVLPE